MSPKLDLKFSPLTSARWRDLETLFGAKGACGGCWCMYWRLRRSQFDNQKGEGNRNAMKGIVDSGEVPGILAYSGHEPLAWCSVAPRETYPTLDRSRVLKRVDEQPVWSIVCLFVAKSWRRKGVTVELLRAAADYAKRQGAKILEGYPVEPKKDSMPEAFAWTGLASAFRKAGFTEVLRRSETRPIMRRVLQHESRESAARTAPRRRPNIRRVTVKGGLPPGLDLADREQMHEWLRRQK